MLEIEEEDRFSFEQIIELVNEILNPPPRSYTHMLNSNNSQRHLEHSRNNRTPSRQVQPQVQKNTPKNADKGQYRNDVSPFRGRFGGAVKNTNPTQQRRTPERAQGSRSPMRRQVGVSPLSRR